MIDRIEKRIQPLQDKLNNHSLYGKIKSPEQLQIFMQHHVFAVWDFMSLLKSLQHRLTKTQTPWIPIGCPETRYLINEIVLAEETDVNMDGKRQSHFEMYIDAMNRSGASTEAIEKFLKHIEHGTDIFLVIAISELPQSVKEFLKFTFEVIEENKPHKTAAAFTFGRENLIPMMFNSIIEKIQTQFPAEDLELFKYYFDRHIELDEDEHGPMALKMIENLCGDDDTKWKEVEEVSIEALEKRLILWNGIETEIKHSVLVS